MCVASLLNQIFGKVITLTFCDPVQYCRIFYDSIINFCALLYEFFCSFFVACAHDFKDCSKARKIGVIWIGVLNHQIKEAGIIHPEAKVKK